MFKILLIDDDINFVIKLQKVFPRSAEWMSATKPETVKDLILHHKFDYIIARKKNEQTLEKCLSGFTDSENELKLIKKIILMPQFWWRYYLKKQMFT